MTVHTAVPLNVTHVLARRPKEPWRKANSCSDAQRHNGARDCMVLPQTVNVSLVRIGDQVQGGIRRGQGEHTAVKRLLWKVVVGGIVLTWHYIHGNRSLQQEANMSASNVHSNSPQCTQSD